VSRTVEEERLTGDTALRLVVAGGKGVGKSALAVRFLTKRFIGEYQPAAELEYYKKMEIDGCMLGLEVLDTSSQSPPLAPHHLLLVLYSITDRSSLSTASDLLRSCVPCVESSQVLLLANKLDLHHLREVDTCEGDALSEKYKVGFAEVSVSDSPEPLDKLLSAAIHQVKRQPKENTRKQPVWTMRGVLDNLLGSSRGSLPPDLADSRKKESRRSIKEVFKKRSV